MNRRVIGQEIVRGDGQSKVTGTCVYAADVHRRDALWGGFLRSPFPHARIRNIDVRKACRLPGVKSVITGGDISPRREGSTLQDKTVLAQGSVRYVGEKVAAVAAIDKDVLENALGLIEVEYDELPAVFDPLEAMKPEAPDIHPDYRTYRGSSEEVLPKNVRSVYRAGKGDVDRAFAESDEIFQNIFHSHMVHQAFLEPRACIVEVDQQDGVRVWHSTQTPFSMRKRFAAHVGLSEDAVVVHPVSIGGSFGGRSSYEEALCAYYLARATGKPVKIVETYPETLQDGQPRHAAVVTLRTGIKRDGAFWAWDGEVVYNGGAYGAYTPINALNGTFMLAGSYRTPHVRMKGYIVYTNQIPCGYFRAPGEVQTLLAVESHVDMIADALGLDPMEVRLRNALRDGDARSTGKPVCDVQASKVLQRLSEMSSRSQSTLPSPKRRGPFCVGRGIAFGDRKIGTGECNVELVVEPDGFLRLSTSVRDQGVGAYTMHRQVVGEILGVDPGRVGVEVKGTEGPYDSGIQGARGTHVEGQAVARAAVSLRQTLCAEAAAIWNVEVNRVQWEKGRAHLEGTTRSLELLRLAKRCPTLRSTGHYKAGRPEFYSFQGVVAEVEVDRETGKVRVTRLGLAYDVGRVINPMIHQGQLDGAVIQGLGFTLTENLAVEEGRVVTASLGDYKIPSVKDVPPFVTSLVRAKDGPGPFGTKSVAESGISVIAPAIANAVYDATGVRITEFPITAEKVLRGLGMEHPSKRERHSRVPQVMVGVFYRTGLSACPDRQATVREREQRKREGPGLVDLQPSTIPTRIKERE